MTLQQRAAKGPYPGLSPEGSTASQCSPDVSPCTPTLFLSTQEAEKLSQPQWPENGDVWSDGEDGTNMDCGLLQAMAEEDEEINVYNEETFGMGV